MSSFLKLPLLRTFLLTFALAVTAYAARPALANDHMFPAAPAARPYVDFDSHGFLIHGKRTFIVSAGMEYARVPRALWRDRLLRFKRAGFNCVEMYNFWDWHEPQENKFDFTGDHDLDAYLKLVHALGMYAICRVGPYYCAEWEDGGYPLWLRFVPGLRVREDNPQFEAAVGGFFDKIIPIIAANQVNHGGAVIMVQLENEDPQGWGTDMPNGYFRFLRDKAVSLGLQVPYFFSGQHHGGDPGSDHAMDDPTRPNPWFTTEFWAVWYSQYGPKPGDADTYSRRTWKIIAHGGNGYNYYMAHGGSNFGYTNNDEDAASYDYGTGVGQGGDLRPIYYEAFKRCAWFARSFQDVLENSSDATSAYQNAGSNPAVRVTARQGQAGTIAFLDNPSNSAQTCQIKDASGALLPAAGPLILAPGEIMPVVQDFGLAPDVRLQSAAVRILGIVPQGDTTTLVIYGEPGSSAQLSFSVTATARVAEGAAAWSHTSAGILTLAPQFGAQQPNEYAFTVGTQHIRVLAVSPELADRMWFVDAAGQTAIVTGPAYVGDAASANGALTLTVERPWPDTAHYPALVYGPTGPPRPLRQTSAPAAHVTALPLAPWQTRGASAPAASGFDDHAWLASDQPLQMGADGDETADAWYRATLHVPAAGTYTLQFAGLRDRGEIFLDGARVSAASVQGARVSLSLTPGAHTLAVFTAHDGRAKLYGYMGPLGTQDPKGVIGPVALTVGTQTTLTDWRMLALPGDPGAGATPPAPDAAGWAAYTVGNDAFNNRSGYAWFQTTLPASTSPASALAVHFGSVDDNGTVYLNGQRLATHRGWNEAFDVPLTGAWNPAGTNVLSVLVQNTDGAGGLDQPVTLAANTTNIPVTGWRMRGGPGDPLALAGWQALRPARTFDGPAFFRSTFTAPAYAAVGAHPIWRVVTTGLGHGSVWVNGHNLGRYPEKIAAPGMYVPEPWLLPGKNSIVIYDEDGQRPDGVRIEAEAAASRDLMAAATAPARP